MKISKLFHWLYGFVMFLPIFAVGGALLISTFNMSAKQESEIIYKYETNEINNLNDLRPNNIYKLDVLNMPNDEEPLYISAIYIFNENGLYNSFTNTTDDFFTIFKANNVINIGSDYMSEGDYTIPFVTYRINLDYIFYIVNDSNNEIVSYCERSQSLPISISDYLPIESVDTNNFDSQDIFYKAIEKVEQSPIFSWSYNSFLVAPFSYIVALFGMPTNHVVVELLSYWLTISIIWLVFDLIMYVPLLVHRWLDKGVLE